METTVSAGEGIPGDRESHERTAPDMNGTETAWQMRREMGRELRARRMAAGWSQEELARRTGKSRSTISTIESAAGGAASRSFWQACDQVLGTRGRFSRNWDQVQQQVDAARA